MKLDANGWLDIALQGGPGWYAKSDDRAAIPYWGIAIHGTSGLGTVNWFNTPKEQSSYASSHFVFEQNGDIWQGIPLTRTSWHAVKNGNYAPFLANVDPNSQLISYEIVKPVGNQTEITPAQKKSVFELTKFLCAECGIPAKIATDASGGIVGHFQIDPPQRSGCPGPFPWIELDNFLKSKPIEQEEDMVLTMAHPFAHAYFTESRRGNLIVWTCKTNGYELFGEIGKFYKACFNEQVGGYLRLPVSGEIHLDEYDIIIQLFETGTVIAFDPKNHIPRPIGSSGPCLLLHRSDPIWQDKMIAPLQAIIARLEKEKATLKAENDLLKLANPQAGAMKIAFRQIVDIATPFK